MKLHEMNQRMWPYSWQRLFYRIELQTFDEDCREIYICHSHQGGVVEFRSMDELDTYARALHRIDTANGEETRSVSGQYNNWERFPAR